MEKTWIDTIIQCFPDKISNRNFYWLFLSALRIPSRLRFRQKGNLEKYCTEDIWAGQKELLEETKGVIHACTRQALAVRSGVAPSQTLLAGHAASMDVTLDEACDQLINTAADWWDQNKNDNAAFSRQADKSYALMSGPRFLAFFAQEQPQEKIGWVVDYYEAVVRFLYLEETDEAAPKTAHLCASLEERLKDKPWRWSEVQPGEITLARKAAHLLLTILFWEMLRALPKVTKGGTDAGIPSCLQPASQALGFIDPGAQELSRLLVQVDALKLQDLCTFVLSRIDFESPEDIAVLCKQIEAILDCVFAEGSRKSIRMAFRQWLMDSSNSLNESYFHLNRRYGSDEEPAYSPQMIDELITRVHQLLQRVRGLMQ